MARQRQGTWSAAACLLPRHVDMQRSHESRHLSLRHADLLARIALTNRHVSIRCVRKIHGDDERHPCSFVARLHVRPIALVTLSRSMWRRCSKTQACLNSWCRWARRQRTDQATGFGKLTCKARRMSPGACEITHLFHPCERTDDQSLRLLHQSTQYATQSSPRAHLAEVSSWETPCRCCQNRRGAQYLQSVCQRPRARKGANGEQRQLLTRANEINAPDSSTRQRTPRRRSARCNSVTGCCNTTFPDKPVTQHL